MNIVWKPQEGAQTKFLSSDVFEVLYGGAAGGGKTDALMADGLRYSHHPHYRGIIFRRTTPQLKKLKDKSKEIYKKVYPSATFSDQQGIWKFPSGGELKLAHLEHDKDKYAHDGQEYQFMGFDELTHFLESQYMYLFSRCRTTHPEIPPYVRSSAMPMGAGITWVKQRFIDNGAYTIYKDPETGLERQFIPATLDDNRIMKEADPEYENRLKLLGANMYKALRYGDWDTIQGAVFEELDRTVHMVEPHMPPSGALVWRCMDWGYSRPFSIGWYYEDCDGRIVRFREWYGCTGKANEGLKMGAREVAKNILEYEQDLDIAYGIADPAIFSKQDDAPSIGENMRDEGVVFDPADNDRIQGKMECHNRLRVEEGRSGFYATSDCKHFWRTIPMMQANPRKPEDVDTDMEDHLYDEWRYALMSRPCLKGRGKIDFGSDTITSKMDW